jgi:hypothetical protein
MSFRRFAVDLLLDQPGKEEVDIGSHRVFMGSMHRDSEDLMEQSVMNDHTDERAGCQKGIDGTKCAVGNSPANVCGQVIIKHFMVFAEKHLG